MGTSTILVMVVLTLNRVTAIMKGAVLNRLGLKLVKFRAMRYSYGLVSEPVFKSGEHPEDLKYRDKVDGNYRCKGVMKWYALIVTYPEPSEANCRVPESRTRKSFVITSLRISQR